MDKESKMFESFGEFAEQHIKEAKNVEWKNDVFRTSSDKLTNEAYNEVKDAVNEVLRIFSRIASEMGGEEPDAISVDAIAFGKLHSQSPDGVVSITIKGFDTRSLSADALKRIRDQFQFVEDIGTDPDQFLTELEKNLVGPDGDLLIRLYARTVPVVDGVKRM